uniref:Uncharacterized protein n=1 Tax=Solanum lycopersicum TaxID=4081 RepID=A0A3Q7HA73_SOLLC
MCLQFVGKEMFNFSLNGMSSEIYNFSFNKSIHLYMLNRIAMCLFMMFRNVSFSLWHDLPSCVPHNLNTTLSQK